MTRARRTAPADVVVEHEIDLPPEATLAVVADTHSHPHGKLPEQLEALAPAAILHAGDIGDRAVLAELAAVAPLYAVRGNIDPRGHRDTPDVAVLRLRQGERNLTVTLTHIAVRGARLLPPARGLVATHRPGLLICGHSHVPLLVRDCGTVVFNPGSVGPRRFNLPITYGLLRFGANGLSIGHVNCETGAPWAP